MGSSNGTFVNGKRTLWQELSLGDQIYCGASQLKFVLLEDGKNGDYRLRQEYPAPETTIQDEEMPLPTGNRRLSLIRLSSPTQPLQQIKPGLFPEELAEQKFDLVDIQTQSVKDSPDIIYQKTRRDAPFSHYKDADRIGKALSTLYKVSELLHSQLDLEKLLDTLLKTTLSITSAQRGCLLLKKSKDSELKIASFQTSNQLRISANSIGQTISRTIVNLAVEQGIATVSSDAMTDRRFAKIANPA